MKILSLLATALTAMCGACMAAPTVPPGGPAGLPANFVYLRDVAPTIVQDMRYATAHNFTGAVVPGYEAAACILTKPAAESLARVQAGLEAQSLTLVVWDCYRPASAVTSFVAWTTNGDTRMKAEFYPALEKSTLIRDGYIASKSGHSRGSTVDLGIARLGVTIPAWDPASPQRHCTASMGQRFDEGVVDMGTAFDCFDTRAHPGDSRVGPVAQANRKILSDAMAVQGFLPYDAEWWHFRLSGEPYPDQIFDAPVSSPP